MQSAQSARRTAFPSRRARGNVSPRPRRRWASRHRCKRPREARMARRALGAGLVLVAGALFAIPAQAAEGPSKPGHIVVPFAAGRAARPWARILAAPPP